MADTTGKPESFLRRWSQRKLAAAREPEAPPAPPPSPDPVTEGPAPAPGAPQAEAPSPAPNPGDPPLPDVESLTFDSDFRAFLSPKVEEGTRRAALKKLFSDPRFNVMDGLDVYIDDYNKFEPMTPEILKQLVHARYLFDPPKTRVNAQGHVEDVVDEPAATDADAGGAGGPPVDAAAPGTAEVVTAPAASQVPSPAVGPAQGGGGADAAEGAAVAAPDAAPAPPRLPSESTQPLPAAQRPPR